MELRDSGLVVWDVDGTLIPADLRWLRRSIAQTFGLAEAAIVFPETKVHGYTDESIVIDTAIASGVSRREAEGGVARFHEALATVMDEGRAELSLVQPPYPGAADSISALQLCGLRQTVLTGNLRLAAEIKLGTLGLDRHLDLRIGAFGSDDRDRFRLPRVIARRFARMYGYDLDASRTVVIGDAPNDIACARQARFSVVVVAHRANRDELAAFHPDAILDRLDPEKVVSAVRSLLNAAPSKD
ncbi:HAD family hydrolase [Krasilnikovia sp. M28-CT-15]|uniref:HAD family hydrolase n=1 Tax=Krasilnikovia sp. M28-CT-15 TaxID=3373540 RepID=UPI003876732F